MREPYRSVLLACGFWACGEVDDVPRDAAPEPDVIAVDTLTADAAPSRCRLDQPFGTPTVIASLSTADAEITAWQDPTERAVFFSRIQGTIQVFTATRARPTDPFGAATRVANVNLDTHSTYAPSLTDNGLTMYVSSDRGGAGYDLFTTSRSSLAQPFGAPTLVANASTVANEYDPYITVDGTGLYFARATGNTVRIFVSRLTAGGFTTAQAVLDDTSPRQTHPVISPDERTLYFASDAAGGLGNRDVWVATRPSASEPFGTPTRVANVSSANDDMPTWISADGCVLIITIDRPNSDLYEARRPAS